MVEKQVQNQKILYSIRELPELVVFESSLTGKAIAVPRQTIEIFLSEGVYALNPYWQYNGLLEKDEVLSLAKCLHMLGLKLECNMDPKLIKKIARYIVIYAENVQLMNFLTASEAAIIHEDREGKTIKEFLNYAIPFLMTLRKLYRQIIMEPKPETLAKMLELCLQSGIDPL